MSARQKDNSKQFINRPQDLPAGFKLAPSEKAYFAQTPASAAEALPFLTTPYYLSLINPDDPYDPVRRQTIPAATEWEIKAYESADPLFESRFSPVPGAVHRYPDRLLILATRACYHNCRHCFRRYSPDEAGPLSADGLAAIGAYIAEHAEIREVIVSGGDPLTLPDRVLERMLRKIKTARGGLVLRLATRTPVVQPARVDEPLVGMLGRFKPLWVLTQFNHPVEITPASLGAAGRLIDRGLPVLNQSVLLKGVNDRAGVLEELFTGLVAARIKPLYLFQGDLAAGTAHFRLPLSEALALYKELQKRLSGLSCPQLAVDLPQGGGKVNLGYADMVLEGDRWKITNRDGEVYYYPEERR